MLTFRSSFANGGCQQTDSGVDVFGMNPKSNVSVRHAWTAFSPVARSTTPARVSSISVDTKIRVFPFFQTRFFWSKMIEQMYKAKGRSFGWKRCTLETFSKCTPHVRRITFYMGSYGKTFRPNISKTKSPSLYITYMYIIHKNMKNKSYYGFETKKGPFSFSIIAALRLGIFRRTQRQ